MNNSGPHIKQMVTSTRKEINTKLKEIKELENQMDDYEKRRSEYCNHEPENQNLLNYVSGADTHNHTKAAPGGIKINLYK